MSPEGWTGYQRLGTLIGEVNYKGCLGLEVKSQTKAD